MKINLAPRTPGRAGGYPAPGLTLEKILSGDSYSLIFLILIASAGFLMFLNNRPLWAPDEIRVAGIGANMLIAKSWAVPLLNGHPFLEKPPLYFWTEALCFHILGFTPLAAKLPSALSAIAGAAGLFLLSRSSGFSRSASLMAAMMLAVSVQYFITGRRCITDLMLTSFVIWIIYSGFRLLSCNHRRHEVLWTLLYALLLAGGLLTKGFVALAIPLAALLPWYVIANDFNTEKILSRQAGLWGMAIIMALTLFGIWLVFLYQAAGIKAVWEVVWANNFGRFSGFYHGHAEPFWYYLRKLPEQVLPWAIVIPVALPLYLKEFVVLKSRRTLLIISWLIFPFIMLSFASGKRPIYLIPLHPAAAWMAAVFLDDCIRRHFKWCESGKLIKYLLGILLLAGAGAGTFFSVFLHNKGALLALPGLLVCITVLPLAASLKYLLHEQFYPSLFLLLVGIMILFADWYAFGSHIKWPDNSLNSVFQHVSIESAHELALYRPDEALRGAAVFYLKRVVPEFFSETEVNTRHGVLQDKTGKRPGLLLVGTKKDLDKISGTRTIFQRKVKRKTILIVAGVR